MSPAGAMRGGAAAARRPVCRVCALLSGRWRVRAAWPAVCRTNMRLRRRRERWQILPACNKHVRLRCVASRWDHMIMLPGAQWCQAGARPQAAGLRSRTGCGTESAERAGAAAVKVLRACSDFDRSGRPFPLPTPQGRWVQFPETRLQG